MPASKAKKTKTEKFSSASMRPEVVKTHSIIIIESSKTEVRRRKLQICSQR